MHISNERNAPNPSRFEVKPVMLENRRNNNVYWIKDILTDYTMCVRKTLGEYSFVGMMEEEAERKVIEYECEQFFYEKDSYIAALLKFAVRIVQSST